MSPEPSLNALRDAAPRNEPDFDALLEQYHRLESQITADPPHSTTRSRRRGRRRLIGLSAGVASAAVLAAVVGSLVLGGGSAQNAYAAAHRALAATSAQRSGTKTLTINGTRLYTLHWNDDRIALTKDQVSPLVLGHVLGHDRQMRLIRGTVYVQSAEGTWTHYAEPCVVRPSSCPSTAGAGYKLGPDVVGLRAQVKGDTAREILSVATGLHRSTGSDGTTVYTGTIRNVHADPVQTLSEDDIMAMIAKLRGGGASDAVAPGGTYPPSARLTLVVGHDGLVQRISFAFRQPACTSGLPNCHANGPPADGRLITWTVRYSHLGEDRPITAPSSSR